MDKAGKLIKWFVDEDLELVIKATSRGYQVFCGRDGCRDGELIHALEQVKLSVENRRLTSKQGGKTK